MGTRNTADQQREYNRVAEERRRKAGYRRHTVIVHDDDWPKVQQLATQLRQRREQS